MADAARDHDLADAAAQYQQSSGQISATGALATALATPAVQYGLAAAAAENARSVAVATAEKNFRHQQVDNDSQASSTHSAAVSAADAARDAALATANASWWSAEANAHADRAVAQAATDHAWSIATLAADQARLLTEGLAQKALRDTRATAYRSAPTGGSQLVLATASATLPGTLAIAAQIGYSLSAAGWQAISDQVGDRMQQCISQIPAAVITARCISMLASN